ncbi:MAG: peroxiredoxin [Robiginitomaculum sp.]
MSIQKGGKLPAANFLVMGSDGPESKSTQDIFAGKKVALFALPGAFTPTCSATHLPGYVENADALRAKGIDTIVCLSVNDVFVMHAWGQAHTVGNDVMMLADGNGDFTNAVGLEMDGSGFGMGLRSQRYAMVVDDGVVSTVYVETPGEFEVSSADYMLKNL